MEKSAEKSAEQIDSQKLLLIQKVHEYASEPEQDQHIHEYMPKAAVYELVCQKRPRLIDKIFKCTRYSQVILRFFYE